MPCLLSPSIFLQRETAGVTVKMDYELLKNTRLFKDLDEPQIADICTLSDMRVLTAEKNTFILKEGEETRNAGYMLTGSALSYQEDFSAGFRNVVASVDEGCIFALPSSLLRTPYPFSLYTREDCTYLSFDASRLYQTQSSSRQGYILLFLNNLLLLSASDTHVLYDKISCMTQRTTKARLMAYLTSKCRRENSRTISIDFNRQMLADYLGVDRAAMTVVLTELMNEGYINFNKNDFTLSQSALEDF